VEKPYKLGEESYPHENDDYSSNRFDQPPQQPRNGEFSHGQATGRPHAPPENVSVIGYHFVFVVGGESARTLGLYLKLRRLANVACGAGVPVGRPFVKSLLMEDEERACHVQGVRLAVWKNSNSVTHSCKAVHPTSFVRWLRPRVIKFVSVQLAAPTAVSTRGPLLPRPVSAENRGRRR